jgi:23S rRNA G2445 N2-methylase RlmL
MDLIATVTFVQGTAPRLGITAMLDGQKVEVSAPPYGEKLQAALEELRVALAAELATKLYDLSTSLRQEAGLGPLG